MFAAVSPSLSRLQAMTANTHEYLVNGWVRDRPFYAGAGDRFVVSNDDCRRVDSLPGGALVVCVPAQSLKLDEFVCRASGAAQSSLSSVAAVCARDICGPAADSRSCRWCAAWQHFDAAAHELSCASRTAACRVCNALLRIGELAAHESECEAVLLAETVRRVGARLAGSKLKARRKAQGLDDPTATRRCVWCRELALPRHDDQCDARMMLCRKCDGLVPWYDEKRHRMSCGRKAGSTTGEVESVAPSGRDDQLQQSLPVSVRTTL